MDDGGTPIHHAASSIQIIDEISNIERYYDAKVMAAGSIINKQDQSVHFGTKSPARAADIDTVSVETDASPDASMLKRWVPPSHLPEDANDYPSSALGRDGLL